ncbi:MAG: hypothetical protein ACKO3H_13810, partial [Verrucomicrobiota bacterium]
MNARSKTPPSTPPAQVQTPIAPPHPDSLVIAERNPRSPIGPKHPLDPRENPAARDSRGTATRTEIRREAPRVTGPRLSLRPAERSGQDRSHKRATRGEPKGNRPVGGPTRASGK